MNKKLKQAIILFGVSVLLAIISLLAGIYSEKQELKLYRNEAGQGTKTEELRVSIGGKETVDMQVEIEEREYTKKELESVFAEALDKLEGLILGENENLNNIEKPLHLIEAIPDTGIKIGWEIDRLDVMNIKGELLSEKIDKEGTIIKLRAILNFRGEEVAKVFYVKVYPPRNDEKAMQILEIKKELAELNRGTKESENFILPETIGGKRLYWERKGQPSGLGIIFFGIIGAAYIFLHGKEKEKKKQRERAAQMLRDYPEILNQFALLLGAGMSVKNAWCRIVLHYQEGKKEKGIRYAYEEMSYTHRELQNRVMEAECYEKFGRRCQVQQYIKFGALLSQNLRKGSAGLTQLLKSEAKLAFEERKHQAKRMGEEASTKLLAPMFLMLLIVLIIVMIPAFFSFQFK